MDVPSGAAWSKEGYAVDAVGRTVRRRLFRDTESDSAPHPPPDRDSHSCCPAWTVRRVQDLALADRWAPVLMLTDETASREPHPGPRCGGDEYMVQALPSASYWQRLRGAGP